MRFIHSKRMPSCSFYLADWERTTADLMDITEDSMNGDLENLEIRLLLDAIFEKYGYDFRNYAPASLKRRILKAMEAEKLANISVLQGKILHDPNCMRRLLNTISVDATTMFRDPRFYQAFRAKVVPILRKMHHFRIWHAGCATGEEVYSMAILLQEEDILDKAHLYATDMNENLLHKAEEGIFPLKQMQDCTENYLQAGGVKAFSEYYTARYNNVIFRPEFKKNIVWAIHNLVTDASFNEFQVILCRNVMIYFNQTLQNQVHELFYESLAVEGVLGLGSKESLKFSPHENDYKFLDEQQKIYRKIH